MALTPQSSDAFIREVDEELRREQISGFWKSYGLWVALAIVVSLLSLGGYMWWTHQQQQVAGVEGERLAAALDDLSRNQPDKAKPVLDSLVTSDSAGYRAAAKLSLADLAMQKDDLKGAAAAFKAIAADETLAKPYRDAALIRQTAAEYDMVAPDVVITRLKPLAVPGNPWFGSAGEMVAMAYLKQNKPQLAGPLFAAIGSDPGVPRTIRSRAVQMAGLLGIEAADPSNESAAK